MAYDEELADRIRELIWSEPDVTEKKMFGGLAFLIGGHMAVSVSGQGGLLLRVDPEDQETLLQERHTDPFVMRGTTMAGWMRVRAEGVEQDDDLKRWVAIGVDHARGLEPK